MQRHGYAVRAQLHGSCCHLTCEQLSQTALCFPKSAETNTKHEAEPDPDIQAQVTPFWSAALEVQALSAPAHFPLSLSFFDHIRANTGSKPAAHSRPASSCQQLFDQHILPAPFSLATISQTADSLPSLHSYTDTTSTPLTAAFCRLLISE